MYGMYGGGDQRNQYLVRDGHNSIPDLLETREE
jgi:hypothetical protein